MTLGFFFNLAGPNYLPSYAAGVRCGIRELGDKLLGQDPTQLHVINDLMDYHLKGHPYVKSPLDMACWDILGKVDISLFVFSIDGPNQNATSLLTPVSNIVFHALLSGTLGFALHGSFYNHLHERI